MRRQIVLAVFVVLAVVGAASLLVLGSQQGAFANKSKRLLTQAQLDIQQGAWEAAQLKLDDMINLYPESPQIDEAMLALGITYQEREIWDKAKEVYKSFIQQFPESPFIAEVQERLGSVNMTLIFSPMITDYDAAYEVQPGDTLVKIAALHNTTIDLIKRANGLKNDLIRPKQQLKIPAARFEILVDKSQRQLMLTQGGEFVKSYPIATGRNDSTPEGDFTITTRIPNPVWYTQGAVVPPESKENVLGTRWLGFDKKGYGIHGTVDPEPISEQQTAGCVRMTNPDVEELFAIVPEGTKVTIVN
jgi:lipoprotein-anchoring transpeptidase ErfK/SrfK